MDVESRLALDEDGVEAAALASEFSASLAVDEEDEQIYWLTASSKSAPEETYFVRIIWTSYPHSPPSVKFTDAVGGRDDLTTAWPVIPGYRPGNFDICQPFTAEGFAVHPEWAGTAEAWPIEGNPFLWVVETILRDLTERYGGRSG